MNRSVLSTALATSITRIFGFIRTSFLSSALGTSVLADSFFLAFKIPNLFRRILAEGAMQSGFVPIFSSLDAKESENNKWTFFMSVWIFTVIICGIVVLGGITFAKQIIHFFCIFSNNLEETTKQATTMLQMMFPYLGLICMTAILQSTLNTFGIFALPALSPILLSVSIIWGCYIGTTFFDPGFDTAKIICLSVLTGGGLQLIFLTFCFWYSGYLYKAWGEKICINSQHIWLFSSLLIPFVISNSTHHFGSLILDPLVLSLETGSFAALQYSIRLQELPLGILTVSITTVYLPILSKGFCNKYEKEQQKPIEEIFSISMLLIIPCMVIALCFYKDIVSVVYQGGLFSKASMVKTSECFFYHAIAILPISCNRILISIYQANRNTRAPAKLAISCLPIEIFLAFILCYINPHPKSIAIAALISAFVYSGLLVKNLSINKFFTTTIRNLFFKFFVIFLVATTSVMISKKIFNWLFWEKVAENLFNYTTYFSKEKFFLLSRLFFSSICTGSCILPVWYWVSKKN